MSKMIESSNDYDNLSDLVDSPDSNAKLPEKLLSYLKAKGENHNFISHYTNAKSYKLISETKYLRLTRIDKVNDLLEAGKIEKSERNKYYLLSFQYGKNENIAMWHMYSMPWHCAVRLSFKAKDLVKQLESATVHRLVKKDSKWVCGEELTCNMKSLNDILYVGDSRSKDNTVIKKGMNDRKEITRDVYENFIKGKDKLYGLIKGAAWAYENEVRLIVKLNDKLDDNISEYIGIKFKDDSFFNNIQVMTGPHYKIEASPCSNDKVSSSHYTNSIREIHNTNEGNCKDCPVDACNGRILQKKLK